jgi:hypothetical protein
MRRQLRAFNYLLHRKFRRISQVYSSAEAATGMIHGWMVLPTFIVLLTVLLGLGLTIAICVAVFVGWVWSFTFLNNLGVVKRWSQFHRFIGSAVVPLGVWLLVGFGALKLAPSFPTPKEIATEVVAQLPARTQEVGREQQKPTLNLIFKNSPLFTDARKERIRSEMEKFHRYLVQLGLDVPTEMPPIGTTKRAKTSLVVHPAPIYEGYTYIPEKSLDDPTEAHRVYARYCFPFLLDAYKAPRDGRITAASIFSNYFTASFSDSSPPTGDSPLYQWTAVLWEIRQQTGKAAADQIVAFALKSFKSSTDLNPKEEFDRRFYRGIISGVYIVENDRSQLPKWDERVKEMMSRNGFSSPPSF